MCIRDSVYTVMQEYGTHMAATLCDLLLFCSINSAAPSVSKLSVVHVKKTHGRLVLSSAS